MNVTDVYIVERETDVGTATLPPSESGERRLYRSDRKVNIVVVILISVTGIVEYVKICPCHTCVSE